MKNLILHRGAGKTTRLLAMSEFMSAPIVCANAAQRQNILQLARSNGYNIPNPYTAHDLLSGKMVGSHTYTQFLVDESQDVLSLLISGLTGAGADCVLGMTTTDERLHPKQIA